MNGKFPFQTLSAAFADLAKTFVIEGESALDKTNRELALSHLFYSGAMAAMMISDISPRLKPRLRAEIIDFFTRHPTQH